MKKTDKMLVELQKLYTKRSALDTQIQGMEASLIAELKAKSAAPAAEKPEEKPKAKNPAASKKPAKQ